MEKADKILYDRKTAYLDYVERGKKLKNGGFARWEVRNDICRIQIHVRGLYMTDTLPAEIGIYSKNGRYTVARLQLNCGRGDYADTWNSKDMGGTSISYTECDGIYIQISENRILQARWRDRREAEPAEEPVLQSVEMVWTKPEEQPAERQQKEAEQPAEQQQKEEAEQPAEKQQKEEMEQAPESLKTQEKKEPAYDKREKISDRISADKWEQLNKMYPHIHPFGDGREYLSIKPRDFVVLAKQHQCLVQNSFLLHGYYNYGHVILTRIKEREKEVFYLGVPGVYYDREKQAALMFGFEGFESGDERTADGGFGYYMKRVDI